MNMEKISIVFMGTMDFAVPILKALDERYDVVQVITQPDRPFGRKQELKPSAVKAYALSRNLPVFQPEKIRKDYEPVLALKPDLIVVAAFGQMIPKILLDFPPFKCINVHASLLPKYRGGSPMQKSITSGDSETGVTIMFMAEKMDAGDLLAQKSIPILESDTLGTIEEKLALLGSDLLMETLPKVFDKTIVPVPQNESAVTFAYNIKREEEFIDFSRTAKQVFDHVRGFNPRPIASARIDGTTMKLFAVKPVYEDMTPYSECAFGEIVKITKSDVLVKVSDGLVALKNIQLEGKKPMDIKALMNGNGKSILTLGKILK
jgi:methionyl-tRNA formyltransferase